MAKRWTHLLPRGLRLWWAERRIRREYPERIKKAKIDGNKSDAEQLQYDYQWNLQAIDEARLSSIQKKLIRKARRLMLPVPPKDEKKIMEYEDDNWYLGVEGEILMTNRAMTDLRREIRREQKEKLDLFLPWISLLIGLLGAASAFVSILAALF